MNKANTQMTLEQFTAEFEALTNDDNEKAATILAQTEPELYARYWVEVCGEDAEV